MGENRIRCAGQGRWADDLGASISNAPPCGFEASSEVPEPPPGWTYPPPGTVLSSPCPRCNGALEVVERADPKVEQTTTTTPDKVEQAIQAAYLRLLEHYPSDHGGYEAIFGVAGDIATDAVEAATPILLERLEQVEGLLRSLRDENLRLRSRLGEVERAVREFLEADGNHAAEQRLRDLVGGQEPVEQEVEYEETAEQAQRFGLGGPC
jgi:uncharacterized Zn finger protein (UPF0148 family)